MRIKSWNDGMVEAREEACRDRACFAPGHWRTQGTWSNRSWTAKEKSCMTRNYRGCPSDAETRLKDPKMFHDARCRTPRYKERVTRPGKSAVKCLSCGCRVPRWAVLAEQEALAKTLGEAFKIIDETPLEAAVVVGRRDDFKEMGIPVDAGDSELVIRERGHVVARDVAMSETFRAVYGLVPGEPLLPENLSLEEAKAVSDKWKDS